MASLLLAAALVGAMTPVATSQASDGTDSDVAECWLTPEFDARTGLLGPTTSSNDCVAVGLPSLGAPVDVSVEVGECDCAPLFVVEDFDPGDNRIVDVDVPPLYIVDCVIDLPTGTEREQVLISHTDSCPLPFGTAVNSTTITLVDQILVSAPDPASVPGDLVRIEAGFCDVTIIVEDPLGTTTHEQPFRCANLDSSRL